MSCWNVALLSEGLFEVGDCPGFVAVGRSEFWWGEIGLLGRLESVTALRCRRRDLLLELLGGEGPAMLLSDGDGQE